MENIRPWCISRQLWWGHRLPVYYRGEETYVGTEAPAGEGWTRDPDVLDTWFSSALWPFATLGWPESTPELNAFYPTDVLVTARDIIFLWVARMIMMGLEFTGQIPFADVYVHAIIQAPDGRRMSKSLGTGIDPLDLIEGGPRPPVFAKGGKPRAIPRLRRRRAALGAAGHVLRPGRPLLRRQARAGTAADQQALERRPADPARRRSRRAGGEPPRTAEDRWILSRLAAHANRGRRSGSSATTSRTPRWRSTTSSMASCATGTWSWSSPGCGPASPSSPRTCSTC